MKKNISRVFHSPWYFLTFAASPVLALLSHNISQIRPEAGLRSLVLVLILACGLWLALRRVYRQAHRAAFAVSTFVLLFFSYGHVADYIGSKLDLAYFEFVLAVLWLVLWGLALLWAASRKTDFEQAAAGLNVVSLALVLVSTVQIAAWSIPRGSHAPVDDHAPLRALQIPQGEVPPDIYYIIVDSYGRSDLLQQAFAYDNSGFLAQLEQLGFYVADLTRSNYNRTDVSLASSLNMDYLQDLDDDYHPGNLGRRTLWTSISRNTVRYQLEQLGYQSVAFATGFSWSEWTDADVYYSPSPFSSAMTGFETLLLRTTPLRHLEDTGWINLDAIDGRRYHERTGLIFSSMDEVARLPGPKFVFIHIIPPHPPFIYSPDGTLTDPGSFLNEQRRYTADSYTRGYRNQVAYMSSQLIPLVETLLASSAQPPVIILQGDHAPWLQTGYKRFLVLNAYYLPGHQDVLYPEISPVNTFRVVFNSYFGAEYDILPDVSYYSPVPDVYEFEEVTHPILEP